MFSPREVTVGGVPTIYQLYAPPDLPPPIPVILFLHGAGESGTDSMAPTTVGIGPAIRKDPARFPALVVFPQASHGYGWRGFNLEAAVAALDDVERSYEVDPDRVSITGISMGGFGTWRLALEQPERFACAVPVCGGLDQRSLTYEEAAWRLELLPQWIFHGSLDDIITVDHSRLMVDALREAGAKVKYTEYPGVRHNSWDRAYAEPELLPWIMRQSR